MSDQVLKRDSILTLPLPRLIVVSGEERHGGDQIPQIVRAVVAGPEGTNAYELFRRFAREHGLPGPEADEVAFQEQMRGALGKLTGMFCGEQRCSAPQDFFASWLVASVRFCPLPFTEI